jgi:P4 family phage/plasmid primase-like protien
MTLIKESHGLDLADWFQEGNTYPNLLDIIDAAEVFTDATIVDSCKIGTEAITAITTVLTSQPAAEADDDPHRLARVNLERYATRNNGRTLAFWRDEWYIWKRNSYRKITVNELRAKLAKSIKEEYDRICREKQVEKEIQPARDGDDQPIVSQKVTMSLVTNVLQATSGEVCISSDVEPNTWLPSKERRTYISMANGILDIDEVLADGDDYLLPNSPKWFSLVSLPYNFDPDATCPKWLDFLNYNLEGDQERIRVLQEWAGYLLTPSTDEQIFMIMEGEGKNGKSVYIAGVQAMLGTENVSNVALESFGERFELTQTVGKLLNAVDDCGDLDKVAEGKLKTFVSGAPMFFDRKGVEGYSKAPTARLMVACNNRPHFSDRSDAIWRRMKVIPWCLQVPEEKRIRGMDKVPWWQNSGELPGILLWAIRGLERLRKQGGFSYCQMAEEAKAEYKEEMNPARVFLMNNMEHGETGIVKCADVYKFYRKWIDENGYRPLSEKVFGKEVKRVFKKSRRVNRGTRGDRFHAYEGIQFTQDEICGLSTNETRPF